MGEDQLLNPEESITLDAGSGFLEYLWQDNSEDRYLQVSYDVDYGDYLLCYVDVFDGHCYNNDSVRIEFFFVEVPNVFTPNGDGVNDKFLPMEDGYNGVKNGNIIIMNRWGQKVWESAHFDEGWDGNINGNPASEGVYFWILEVIFGPESQRKVYQGSVNVIR